MYVCLCVYFDSIVHYTGYVNVRQIKQIQIYPEPRPTHESLEDCGWVLSNSGWPNIIIVITLYKTADDAKEEHNNNTLLVNNMINTDLHVYANGKWYIFACS